jgi:hypothetical protein
MIVTTTFQRKTFVVEAKQVLAEDIRELAEWCGGTFVEAYHPDFPKSTINFGQPCIEIEVPRSNGKKMRAFIGDWITHISGSDKFKVYRDKTFKEAFEEILRDFPEEMMRKVVREELALLLRSMGKTARGLYGGMAAYNVGDLEQAGYRAIERVAELEESLLPHAWNCELRNPAGYDEQGNPVQCSCGVGDDE